MLAVSSGQMPLRLLLLFACIASGLLAVFYPVAFAGFVVGGMLLIAASISPLSVFALLLILSPLRTLIATESAIQLPLDIGQLTFVIFVCAWWWHRSIDKRSHLHLPESPVFISIAAFTVVSGLTVFSALSMQFWLTEWLKWVTMLVVIVLVMDTGQARRWEIMLAILVSAGLANAIVGLYIFFGGSGADHLLINSRFFRAFGTFGQPNPFGGFLGIILPIAIMSGYAYLLQIWTEWRISKHIKTILFIKLGYYGIASAIMLAGIVASWSRGAWLGFVVSVAVMAFCLPRKLWQSVALSTSAMVIVTGLWFGGFIPASIQTRVLSSTEELFSFSDVRGVDITHTNYAIVERLAHWQAAINMARENPWLGVGLGNYEIAYEEYRLINWEFPLGHAHNYYLNILGEAGMIGFLFYAGMWITILIITWKTRSHPDRLARAISVGLMGSWAYLGFHSLLDNLYVNNIFLHLSVMFGFLAMFYHQIQNSTQWGHYVSSNKH